MYEPSKEIGPGVNEALESELSEDDLRELYDFQQQVLPIGKRDCPECSGYGRVKAGYYGRRGVNWRTFYHYKDCPRCHGTGKYRSWDMGGDVTLRAGSATSTSGDLITPTGEPDE